MLKLLGALYSVLLLTATSVSAAPKCQDLFSAPMSTGSTPYGASFSEIFYQNLIGPTPEEDLRFLWGVPFPSYQGKWSKKAHLDFVGRPNDPVYPLETKSPFLGYSNVVGWQFHDEIYRNYAGKYQDDLIAILKAADRYLKRERMALGQIGSYVEPDKKLGTFRIYDGSKKPWGLFFDADESRASENGGALPFQVLRHLRKMEPLPVEIEILKHVRSGKKVFELGKLIIDDERPATERDRLRNLIELFWLDRVVAQFPDDTIYVAHVVTPAHARLYRRRYGFEVKETFSPPGAVQPEMILTVSGRTLREHLSKATGLSPAWYLPANSP